MTLLEISPDGIKTLFERPQPCVMSMPASSTPEFTLDTQKQEHPFLVLSPPIPVQNFRPGESYLMKDNFGRVVSVEKGINGDYQWATLAWFSPNNVFPVRLSQPSADGLYTLSVQTSEVTWLLHANNQVADSDYTFWASADFSRTQPIMNLQIKVKQTSPTGPTFYSIAGTIREFRCC